MNEKIPEFHLGPQQLVSSMPIHMGYDPHNILVGVSIQADGGVHSAVSLTLDESRDPRQMVAMRDEFIRVPYFRNIVWLAYSDDKDEASSALERAAMISADCIGQAVWVTDTHFRDNYGRGTELALIEHTELTKAIFSKKEFRYEAPNGKLDSLVPMPDSLAPSAMKYWDLVIEEMQKATEEQVTQAFEEVMPKYAELLSKLQADKKLSMEYLAALTSCTWILLNCEDAQLSAWNAIQSAPDEILPSFAAMYVEMARHAPKPYSAAPYALAAFAYWMMTDHDEHAKACVFYSMESKETKPGISMTGLMTANISAAGYKKAVAEGREDEFVAESVKGIFGGLFNAQEEFRERDSDDTPDTER